MRSCSELIKSSSVQRMCKSSRRYLWPMTGLSTPLPSYSYMTQSQLWKMLMLTLGQAQKERNSANGIALRNPNLKLRTFQPCRAAFLATVPPATTKIRTRGANALTSSHIRNLELADHGVQSMGMKMEGQFACVQPNAFSTQLVYAAGIFASYVESRTVVMPKNENRTCELHTTT